MIANGFTVADRGIGTNSVEILDIETKMSCAAFPSVPVGFRGGGGGLFDQTVPRVCSGFHNVAQCYLYKNNAWNKTGSLSGQRLHFSVVSGSPFGNPAHKFYVVGGDIPLTGEVFDGDKFLVVAPPVPFYFYLSCMVYLNAATVMLIGGQQGSNPVTSSTYIMNSKMSGWQQGPSINVARYSHGCGRIVQGVASEKFSTIIVGGNTGGALSKRVEFLDDGATSWRNGPDLQVPTQGAPIVKDQRGGIIFVGGDKGAYSNIIYRLRHAGAQLEIVVKWPKFVPRK